MKTKKHKKHKSERHEEERTEKEPLRLVLKVGDSLIAHSPHHESKKHKHKKKKKKKSKDHHRHDEEKPHKHHRHREETENEMEISQEEVEEEPPKRKEEVHVESEDTEQDEIIEVPTPHRIREKPIVPVPVIREDESGVLRIGLKYIQEKLQGKDVNGFFAYPVNDMIAPNYSMIIAVPMDFSTMMTKVDNNEYKSILEYKKDFVLMCNNAMTYNRPETIYYKEAKRLFHIGMKLLSKEKLLFLKRTLPFMASLRYEELGFDEPDDTKALMEVIVQEEKEQKQRAKDREDIGRFEAVPDNLSATEILSQAQAAAKEAADLLTLRQAKDRFGFLRKKDDGTTSMILMNPDNTGIVSKKERVISIGALVGKLGSGGSSLAGYKEDKRNRVTPGQYLNYGPFGSYAPQYDSTFANMTKDETDLLLSTYGDETGVGYAKSVMSFVEKGGDYAVAMVDNLLDILTKGEHAKTKALLEQKLKDDGGGKAVVGGSDDSSKSAEDKNNVDFDSLRGLSDLGVDMSFLDSMEKTMKKEKDPVQEKLDQTATLINDLQQTQTERLSKNLPPHISQVPGPSEKEIKLAQKVNKELKELAQEANPGNIATVPGLRKAMGVTYGPSDATINLNQTITQSSNQDNKQTDQVSHISTNRIAVSVETPVNKTVQLLQGSTFITGNQNNSSQLQLQSQPQYSTNIPNIISQHMSSTSYQPQPSNISSSATIVQQPQIIQPTSVAFQTSPIVASTSLPFQTSNPLYNQPITVGSVPVVGQEVQNAPGSGVTASNNDDDSDIEMDISEFLQFPSS